MGTRNKWRIFNLVLVYVAICLERSLVESCGTNGSNKCANITSGTVCYINKRDATITCNGNTTNHSCSNIGQNVWSWTPPTPNNCTDSSVPNDTTSTINNTIETTVSTSKINNSATTTTITTTTTTTTLDINTIKTTFPTTQINNSATTTTTHTTTTNGLTSDENHTEPVLRQKQSGGYVALYVGVPCVIVVLVVPVILFIVWRRKNSKTNTKQNGFEFHNESYHRHDRASTNNAPIPMSDLSPGVEDNQYSDIPADTVNPCSENENTYNTIDLPEGVRDNYCHVTGTLPVGNDNTYNTIDLPDGVRDNYCHVTGTLTVANDNTYSHMPDSSTTTTDNTYSHMENEATGTTLLHQEQKPTSGSADTYNTLQTLPNNRVQTKLRKTDVESDHCDLVYNHLANDLKQPTKATEDDNGDTYSHICQAATTSRTVERRKTTPVLNQPAGTVLKNDEDTDKDEHKAERASNVSPPYLEFQVEDQTDGNTSPIKFSISEHQTNDKDDEVATNPHYFILEKEDTMTV